MRSQTVVFRVGLALLGVLLGLNAATADEVVSRGDRGKLMLTIRNDSANVAPDAGVTVEPTPGFTVESYSPKPVDIPAGGSQQYIILYNISQTAPDGSLSVVVKSTFSTRDLDLSPESLRTTYFVDSTPPTLNFLDSTGAQLRDAFGAAIGDHGTINSTKVRVQADDTGGSGIVRVTIIGPTPFDPTVFAQDNFAITNFEELEDGDYTVFAEDKAGNISRINFTIGADQYAPQLLVHKMDNGGELIGDGGDTDVRTLYIVASDIVLNASPFQSGLARISIIGLDGQNDFENTVEYTGQSQVSFSTTLPLGDYWITATDREGNVAEQTFGIVSGTGPISTMYVTNSHVLYRDFRGLSVSTPSMITINTGSIDINPTTGEPNSHGFMLYSARAPIVGLSAQIPITQISITGDNINQVTNVDPPQAEFTGGSGDIPAGTYQMTIKDASGGVTFMPFRLDDLTAYLCPSPSSVFVSSVAFTVSGHVCLKSTRGFKSIQESNFAVPSSFIGPELPLTPAGGIYTLTSSVNADAPGLRRFTVTDLDSNNATFEAGGMVLYHLLVGSTTANNVQSLKTSSADIKADGMLLSSARLIGADAVVISTPVIVHGASIDSIAPVSGRVVVRLGDAIVVDRDIETTTSTDNFIGAPIAVTQFPELTAQLVNLVVPPLSGCIDVNPNNPNLCDTGYRSVPGLTNVFGQVVGVRPVVVQTNEFNTNVFAGAAAALPIGLGVEVGLPAHGSGKIDLNLASGVAPSRYKNVPAFTTYRIHTDLNLSGPATVSLPFNSAGLTSGQISQVAILQAKVLNPQPKDFLPIPSVASGDKVTGTTSDLASVDGVEFMLVVPVHSDPHIVSNADLTFQSNRADIQIRASEISDFSLRKVLALLGSRGMIPVSPAYHVGPDNVSMSDPGVIEIRFSDSQLSALGIPRSSLQILQFNSKGSVVRMPGQITGADTISAKVPYLTSDFAIFGHGAPVYSDLTHPKTTLSLNGAIASGGGGGSAAIVLSTDTAISLAASDPLTVSFSSSGVAQTRYLVDEVFVDTIATPGELFVSTFSLSSGTHSLAYYSVDTAGNVEPLSNATLIVELPDSLPPRTAFVVGSSSNVAGGVTYVNTATRLGFSVADDKLEIGDGLGVGATQTFYAVDGAAYSRYSSSFNVSVEGERGISFFSVDQKGNVEAVSTRSVFVDSTPPVSDVAQNGAVFTLSAFDPSVAGGASGVSRIRYLVDISNPAVCDNTELSTGAPRGTCSNPWYGGPFTLGGGAHTISIQALDNVNNAETLRTVSVNVNTSGASNGGLGIGRDALDAFWSVVNQNDGLLFAHTSSSGALISAATLQDAVAFGVPWSVFFDPTGRAYAVGDAGGETTQALDLAIYKASPAGDAIESRTLFDSGYGNNDLIFDVKAPGWIVGSAQTSGPADFEVAGERSLSMALWKFDPVLGTVQLSTITGRGIFDLGSGIAVDSDGSLWIIGYSLRPDAPAAGGFDLVLRHYAADGHAILGGPFFKPAYLNDVNQSITAKVYVDASAVYVAAPRINSSGGTDMAFVKFDKATGVTSVEKVWRAGGGESSYPVAILPVASGLLIAGGIGNESANAALWRFGNDGSFLSATTVDAGGAAGAVLRGTQIWLSVDGSTQPYLVQSETTASGSIIDISTPSAPTATLTPSSGPIGVPFTISGAGFGAYAGNNTRVKFGAAVAPLSVWNDTTISGTVPGLSTGAYAVTIERQNASSATATSAGTFTATDLSSAAVSASAGPIGAPFTITGAGFGPYAGTLTRVLVGGATAPLSVWNDATISGTIPGVAAGANSLVIQRATGDGGLLSSAGFVFDVTVPSVAAVSPSSGPIGASFALSGQSFGPYAGTYTQVLVGGATAPLSVWNDTQIVGTVPGSLAPGVHPVIVERRTSDGGLSRANTAYFQVLGLIADAVTPSSGPIGVPFTISGTGFGAYASANTRVKFGATAAALSVWNDATIAGTIPALDTGAWTVTVERQQGADVSSVSAGTFTATALVIASISPSSGPIGTAFTLLGPGFGPYAGSLSVVLVDGATAALSVWNDAKIVGTIPGSLPAGAKTVVARRFSGAGVSSSEPASFEVTGMTLATIAPSSGPIGSPFTITGSQFGVYGGANTRVKFGGVSAALSVWNDSTIAGTIPALPTGAVDVLVERQQGANVSMSNISSFTILGLTISSMTPTEGPIGAPFTIKGSGFGPYAGANTRALVGGVSASLSVWNDTTISGTIPNLAPGSQPVWLERSAGSGVTSSATSYFNVTVPAVATLTPSSAPIGAPFTITGSNFGPYAGANTRVKIGGVSAPLSVWNDTQISGTVPGALSPGAVELVVERAAGAGLSASATQAFEVLLPVISTISPAFGPAGTVVTLTGRGFGPYAGTLTKVLVGGATVPLSVWNDATIRWTVPASLADGDYPVVVERSPAGGTVDSASATFTVGTGLSGASFGFAAVQPLAAKPDSHFEGDLSLSSTTGGRIDTPAKAAVEIPPNAMGADTEITLKRAHGDGLRARAAEEIKKRAAGEPIEFGPEGTRFTTPVTIELPYDPALTADETKLAIHYFNPLTRAWEELPSEVDRARRVVKAKTDHFSIYQPMGLAPTTVAQDEFYFRDQYAFPNPSRGGALVTFRIQPGLAETVEVRVYDLSGRKIHDSSDFTFMGAVDDGNGKGAQNTYDHAWSVGGVGSGVYTYVIKASRGGQKPIVKSGKVGVIR